MMTLKQLVEEQKWNGMSDIQVILTFLDMNNMEEEAMELINELAKSKIGKLKHEQRVVKEWFDILPSKYLYENYDLDIIVVSYANNLQKMSKVFHFIQMMKMMMVDSL